MTSPHDGTASLMTPAKLAQVGAARAPVSPAAWLDRMASDAGHMHIARLSELQAELEAQARARADAPLAVALQQLSDRLPELDFSLLQPRSWWARTTGKGRGAAAEFAAQFKAVDGAAARVATEAQALHSRQPGQAGATDRTLVEFEVEYRAIDKIIDQGSRWLQDMRNQIKTRQAQAPDAAAQRQIQDDTARCEILVARLKALRAAVTAAQQAHQQAQTTAARRASLLVQLNKLATGELKAWRSKQAALAAAAAEDKAPALEPCVEVHRSLQKGVGAAGNEAVQLQTQEQALAQALSVLGQQLAAVR